MKTSSTSLHLIKPLATRFTIFGPMLSSALLDSVSAFVCVCAIAANWSSKAELSGRLRVSVCAREAERAEFAGIDSILRKVSSFFLLFSGLVHECRLTRKACVRFLFLRIDQIHFFICVKR
jgi:hypothetical protein